MSLAWLTFVESYLTSLDIQFLRFFLNLGQVKVKVTEKQYATLCDPKLYPHTIWYSYLK